MKAFFNLLTRHPLSLAGTSISTVSAILIAVFIGLDLLGFHGHPYVGILAYLLVPSLFVLGLILIPIGLHQARKSGTPGQAFPVLDLNLESVRTRLVIFFVLTSVNLVIVGIASFKTVEVMDTTEFCGQACHSVMAPEYTSFQRGAHASVVAAFAHRPGSR